MNKYFLIYLLLTVPIQVYSQEYELKGDRDIIKMDNIKHDAKYYVYKPSFLAKKEYKTQESGLNNWPEEVFVSIISATDQDWLNSEELGGKAQVLPKSHFQNIQNANVDSVYFELKSKLTLFLGDVETSIIKFYFHSPGNKISGVYVFQKINNRWYKTNLTALTGLSVALMRMNEDKLQDILTQNMSNPLTMELLKRIRNNDNSVNLDLLVKEINNWISTKNKKNIDYFIDTKSW